MNNISDASLIASHFNVRNTDWIIDNWIPTDTSDLFENEKEAYEILNSYTSKGIKPLIHAYRNYATNSRDLAVLLREAQVFVNSADQVRVEVILNPTVAGAFAYAAVSGTHCEAAIGAVANTVTGGTRLPCYYNSQNNVNKLELSSSLLSLGCSIAGVMDEIVLCVTPLSANATVLGVFNFKEFL